MKKIYALFLLFVMMLSFCSCGNKADSKWSVQQTKDEFGDVTADSYSIITASVSGTFANTTTENGEMTTTVSFFKNRHDRYAVEFILKENHETNAVYTNSNPLVLKTKVDEEIKEYSLAGNPPNGGLVLGNQAYNFDGDELFHTLYSGSDVRCIINIGNSEYTFTLKSTNFAQVCEENNFKDVTVGLKANEALQIYFDDNGLRQVFYTAADWFDNNYSQFPVLTTDEIKKNLNGVFIEICMGGWEGMGGMYGDYDFPLWTLMQYSMDTMLSQHKGTFEMNNYSALDDVKNGKTVKAYRDYRRFDPQFDAPIAKMEVVDDKIIRSYDSGNSSVQIRKITDNMFLSLLKYDDGIFYPSRILIRCAGLSDQEIRNAAANAEMYELQKITK